MKKIITIVTVAASVAFLPVQAQEAPQSERTQDLSDITNTNQEASVAQAKVEIDQSELPQPVMDSFRQSEYSNMSIVSIYKVNNPQGSDDNSYQSVSDPDGSITSKGNAEGAQESEAQASRALDSAVYQSDETARNPDGVSKQDDKTVVEMSEKVAENHQEPVGEMETPEEAEETGRTMTAEAPSAGLNDQMTEAEIEEKGEKLYEENKYDNYTGATNDAYAEVAEEKVEQAQEGKKYELQVKNDREEVTLTYDENGELVKADKGAM